jgi:ABC-2 type transport system permease protein
MPGAAGLTYSDSGVYAIHPMLVTDQRNTWNRPGGLGPDTGKIACNPLLGDDKRQAVLGLTLTRKMGAKQQRIMIMGDADFMSNAELARRNAKTSNFPFVAELFKWFSNGEFPIDTTRPGSADNKFLIDRDDIYLLRVILLGVIPVILLIMASVLLIRRLRR